MTPALWRSSRRYLFRHPVLFGLSVLGVALGVAVVVAMDLANASAKEAFGLSAETITGKATHQVVGAGGDLDDTVYSLLRLDLRVRDAAPVIDGYVRLRNAGGQVFQVLGIDPLAERPFRTYTGGVESDLDLAAFIATPATALLSEPVARNLRVRMGDTLRVEVEGVGKFLTAVGLITPYDERSARAIENLIIVDIATAQELFDMEGRLTRIDLLISNSENGSSQLARIADALPQDATVVPSTARTETLAQMTRAFNVNLTALSLLALVVGMFLIYNTMTFSVVQRRLLFGRMRAIGVTRGEILQMILAEALLIGFMGTTIGLMLGIVLGQGLVRLVTQTINDLYYVVQVRSLAIAPWVLVKGAGLGLGATVAAAIPPAREAMAAPVSTVLLRSQEETGLRRRIPKLSAAGVTSGLVGGVLLLWPGRGIAVSYVALLFIMLAFALLTPALVTLFAVAVRPIMGRLFGILGRMAARSVVTTLSRTSVAIAALSIALASTVGVGIMVKSFRETVQVWLGYSLAADIYVQPPGLVFRRGDATLLPEVLEGLRRADGIAGVYTVRAVPVSTNYGPTDLAAIEPGPHTPKTFRFKRGNPEAVWPVFSAQDMVIVSEPFSYRNSVAPGDSIELATERGPHTFVVGAVFTDYGSDLGVVMMSRLVYDRYFDDPFVSGAAIILADGIGLEETVSRLRREFADIQDIIVRSNRGLREASLEVFDRTFTVTAVLRLLAVLVAFVGVISALMALQLERARELAVLRANGLTPGQVWRYTTLQTGLTGLVAGLLSIPLGLVLALVLIFVINRRSFGWTLQVDIDAAVLLQALLLALVAALLAGLYPSYKMSKANPARALREE